MRISIAISILILLLAAAVGLNDRRKLSEIRVSHAHLVAEAAELGIPTDTRAGDASRPVTKRAREDNAAEAKAAAKDMIAFALEMEELKDTGGQPDEEMQKRITDLMERMFSLNASQIRILIAEFRANTGMTKETRDGMIAYAIMSLANEHPEAALAIFTESGDLTGNAMMGKHLLSSSLANWASTDPDAALEWIRDNGKQHPDLITEDVKKSLVKGAANHDMKRAFALIGELGLEQPDSALRDIGSCVKTPAERTQYLGLLREYASAGKQKGDNPMMSSLGAIAEGIAKDGFEEGSKWIADNKLTPAEASALASTIGYTAKTSEKGQWISWMGDHLEKGQGESQIHSAMINWTRSDYRAAGEWLATVPEGPTRTASVKGYVQAVAKYDPQTAGQWALTLPPGKDQTDALQNVYRQMPRETPADRRAREAFGGRHGIK